MRSTRIPAWSSAVLGVLALTVSACSHTGSSGNGPGLLPYAAPAGLAELRDQGRRATTERVDVAIILRLNHEAALERLVDDISNPRSAQYHHFLTPTAFDERFAPTKNQIRSVTAALQRAGFTIAQTYPHGTLIRAGAGAAAAERFFRTRIHDFDQTPYGVRYANVTPVEIPRTLRGLVSDIELNNVVYAHAGAALMPLKPSPVPKGPAKPIGGPTYGPDTWKIHGQTEHGWAPRAVADGFDFPVQHGYNGSGVTVGVVIDGTIDLNDLANYKREYDVKQTGKIKTEPVAKATPYGYDPLETSLDVETITGLAPGADIVIYDVPNLSNVNIEAAYQQVLSDAEGHGRHVSIVNSSFGECESWDNAFDNTIEQDAVHGAAIGITFVSVSGDWGATCYHGKSHPMGVNAPASAPHFLGVGGNQSYSSEGITNPLAWQNCKDGFNRHYCATGGGLSTHFKPLPTFQAGLKGLASTTSRNVPDISFPAVFDDIYYSGSYSGGYPAGFHGLIVGTSWGSPIAVALLAEAEQVCGSALGWVNPAVYSIYKKYGEAPYFFDVTSGSNAGYLGKPGGYKAKPGYDNATGIGMPNGITFVSALCR